MSFDTYGSSGGNLTAKRADCAPNYEASAKRLNENLKNCAELQAALHNFAVGENAHRFSKISSLAELVGGLEIVSREISNEYAVVLKQIEDQK